ncbi:something about silencing protein 10 [Naganishia albida]|nr:something about silencing protein 10 [Naganishia albida]
MGRGMKPKKGGKGAAPKSAPKLNGKDASIKRINTYEDTLEEGGVDEFMHNRDKISLAPEQASDDEDDFIGNQGEEVLGLNMPDEEDEEAYDEDEYDEEDEEEYPAKKGRKSRPAEDKTKKGRYGKESDDDESLGFTDEESEADEDEDRGEESWGRQYYAKPSNRYARDADDDDYDSDKELSKSLYAQESEALQKSIRRSMKGEEDFGLDEIEEETASKADLAKFSLDREQPTKKVATPAPPADADPSKLITHLALHDPLKLALARDFPLVVRKLQKTERGIKRMQQDAERARGAGDLPQLNQGLGWLHYQSLLTYATMLAFYLHLASLPEDQRPNFDTHPILPRLAQLKEGVAMLEDLDFDAASIDGDAEDEEDDGINEEEDEDVVTGKAELMARLVGTTGMDWDDADVVWEGGELEDGELDDLREDAAAELSDESVDLDVDEDTEEEIVVPKKKSSKKEKKGKKDKSLNKKSKFVLEEPEFVPAGKSKQAVRSRSEDDDAFGDATVLTAADSADKSAKKRSLRFHTSKIAATSARRAAAREARLGGDDDIPYRSKQAARDAALQRNSAAGDGGEDLDGSEWSEKDKKRAREVMEADDAVEADDGYYDLVKKRKTEAKQAKKEEYDSSAAQAIAQQRQDEAEEASTGPRSLTRSIEKNRGLTPHRKKSTRNPRVKKREQYEKAKIKVSSQRAVYKGGQSALSGAYAGEKSGISQTSKSRRF